MPNSFLRRWFPWFFKPQETKRRPVWLVADANVVVSCGQMGKPNGEGGRGGVAIGSGGMGAVNIAEMKRGETVTFTNAKGTGSVKITIADKETDNAN